MIRFPKISRSRRNPILAEFSGLVPDGSQWGIFAIAARHGSTRRINRTRQKLRPYVCMQEALEARNEHIAFMQLSRVRWWVRVPTWQALSSSKTVADDYCHYRESSFHGYGSLTCLPCAWRYSVISDLKGFIPRYIEPFQLIIYVKHQWNDILTKVSSSQNCDVLTDSKYRTTICLKLLLVIARYAAIQYWIKWRACVLGLTSLSFSSPYLLFNFNPYLHADWLIFIDIYLSLVIAKLHI